MCDSVNGAVGPQQWPLALAEPLLLKGSGNDEKFAHTLACALCPFETVCRQCPVDLFRGHGIESIILAYEIFAVRYLATAQPKGPLNV